ncbi:50S ribosomal protein L9 [Candidatus Falkowbacteria bacterium RIFOXYB2_FULL_38_15]|uniref:Large ribosomal subunit protein bL9 n=1 Tax=Candidatus Falkowbacteria bacterium RIFOXYA2_FULL_38_12 TaxID=1797993 RepID=A0A1F5S3P9_9BACT|nr:MAG: 50S ribosomal protein L9 [Candidatus Falkowbacteria bacterium RIFOXYA2_FULL_38_12]OGF32964.1 MAG: 50S ribosomal protein L9 [Candidatus Falkowbacteria bacterium RIFOXYB2_FULL_38_15]OGF42638.1 MAG: 50S ribosomal protein L9 [Candidatus Falkowbacteria bacterium RIFOXYD2_FULL_39_16]
MKVILLQNVDKIGKRGEIKEVSPGYFRNFLIPRNLAILATDEAISDLEKRKKSGAERVAKEEKKFQKIVKKINGLEILIKTKAGEEGKLYGSVTKGDIVAKIKEKGFEMEPDFVVLDQPIKKIGNYTIVIKLKHGKQAKIYLKVLEE